MNQQPPPPSNFYKGSRPPVVKPIDMCGRGLYETGREGSINFNTPTLPTKAWEEIAQVSKQPSWLLFLDATFDAQLEGKGYVLVFDLNPGDQNQLQKVVNGALARYTFGPVPAASGGAILYEATAAAVPLVQNDNPDAPWAYGLPFNFGIIAVASTTPRVLTRAGEVMALTAYIQT